MTNSRPLRFAVSTALAIGAVACDKKGDDKPEGQTEEREEERKTNEGRMDEPELEKITNEGQKPEPEPPKEEPTVGEKGDPAINTNEGPKPEPIPTANPGPEPEPAAPPT